MGESIAAEVIAGSLGGAFSASALYPLEVLKTKMQAESKSSAANSSTPEATKSENTDQESNAEDDIELIEKPESASNNKKQSMTMIEYAKDMYAKDGITPFYAGIETSAFQSATEKALYFFAYTTLKNTYSLFTGS